MLKYYVSLQTHYVSLQTQLAGLLKRDDRGATAVEYGLIVALIAAVIIAVVAFLGGQILTAFTTVKDNLTQNGVNPPAN